MYAIHQSTESATLHVGRRDEPWFLKTLDTNANGQHDITINNQPASMLLTIENLGYHLPAIYGITIWEIPYIQGNRHTVDIIRIWYPYLSSRCTIV